MLTLNSAIVRKYILNSEYDLNNVLTTGFYTWYLEGGFPSNMPTYHTNRGLLLIIQFGSHVSQTIYDSNGKLYTRFKTASGWSSWL